MQVGLGGSVHGADPAGADGEQVCESRGVVGGTAEVSGHCRAAVGVVGVVIVGVHGGGDAGRPPTVVLGK